MNKKLVGNNDKFTMQEVLNITGNIDWKCELNHIKENEEKQNEYWINLLNNRNERVLI